MNAAAVTSVRSKADVARTTRRAGRELAGPSSLPITKAPAGTSTSSTIGGGRIRASGELAAANEANAATDKAAARWPRSRGGGSDRVVRSEPWASRPIGP